MLELDRFFFSLINSSYTCGFLDFIMPIITEFSYWIPFLLVVLGYLFWGNQGKNRKLAILAILAVGVSDPISSRILKKTFGRKRPCCVEPKARILIGCKGSKSFPSSHAANSAAVAGVIFFHKVNFAGVFCLFLSLVISYSRVYVGVHYPLDVFAGMILGLIIGWLIVRMANGRFRNLWETNNPEPSEEISAKSSVDSGSQLRGEK